MIKTQFEKPIKRIDNGGEFTSNNMLRFYVDQGILLETTCPHTPQQNGVVERKHRHLLETARALRFQANLPIRLWGECILTASYIINRLPSRVLKNISPYEVVSGEKPDYEAMRVFGCLSYYRNTNTKGDKFEPRGMPGVFIGYPQGTKGYKIYDMESRKIVVSRDVRFIENYFPFAHTQQIGNEEEPIFTYPQSRASMHEPSNEDDYMPPCNNIDVESTMHDPSMHVEHHAEPNFEESQTPQQDIHLGGEAQNEEPIDHNVNEQEPPHDNVPQIPYTAREKRNKSVPKRLQEYEVRLPPSLQHPAPDSDQDTSTVHPLSNYVSYDNFSHAHKAFLSAISSNDEPKTFKQASQNANWVDAMNREIKALEENGTWTLEELPKDKKAIDSKWVYKIKYKPNGEIERYKARLVAKGYTQMEGIDFHETFAPVAKLVTVRTLLALATKNDWLIHQLDVNNAFLHGDLDEEVYMKLPQGFTSKQGNKVCRLRKSLYGLKQASRNWYHKFTKALLSLGYVQSKADHSLFLFRQRDTFITALIYVDDVIIAGNNTAKIEETKNNLDKNFSIKDLGTLRYFLGVEVARTAEGLVLSQRKYTLDILNDCGLTGCRPSQLPFEKNLKLEHDPKEPEVDASLYRRIVGRLLYLQATRPDIAYSVNILSQFVSDPRRNHMDAANKVLRYLKTTPGQGILLPKEGGTDLVSYCDSDWLGCPSTCRSRTGYLLLFGGAPISWKSKKQSVVSRSSAEAEYRAMATTITEILWVRWLLTELGVPSIGPTTLYCDNQAARHIANNPVFHERTKHVEMDCYFVRERVETGEIKPAFIDTKNQVADLFTKPLAAHQLNYLLEKLGIRNLHAPT
ncbi:hypothetical protein E3N88_21001 [Mikania micrantha]|uniref:Integrase catalytic domain-containing protein n=1 Tax=Mikania micrantha TaxID=192012 RepID=A0A5N6NLE7_9ASTR|nr:hypothetical protein E3N88_21001 [Mikania micrantha]